MLQPQTIPINFASGLDTKNDPKQIQIGKFLELENTVFTTGSLLKKRNGNKPISTILGATFLTTFNGNLTAIGDSINAYSLGSQSFVSKGSIQPMEVSTLPLIRNNLNQIQCDAAIAPNGLVCTAYSEQNGLTTVIKYAIADSVTGQNVVAPQPIPVTSGVPTGSPRVFVLVNTFIIVFTNVISSASHLQYIAINSYNPTVHTTNADIASVYAPQPGVSWDGVAFQNQLFIAYNTTTGGQAIKVTYLTVTNASGGGAPATAVTFSSQKATVLSMCVDATNPASPVFWAAYFNVDTGNISVLAVDKNLHTILAPDVMATGATAASITCVAQNQICTIFFEFPQGYSYDSAIPTNCVVGGTVAQDGTVGPSYVAVRSVGLASKAFIVDGTIYFLSAYQSPFQPTYFLINGSLSTDASPVVAAKLAYENGGGYLPIGLPNANVSGNTIQISYLYKDLIEALTTLNNSTQTTAGGIYSQTGINLATFIIGTTGLDSAEIGNDLLLSGGFGWMYDGYLPVEQSFFLWPDSVECTWLEVSTVTPTGTVANGSNIVTALSSASGIAPGMTITGTAIPADTTILAVGTTTLTLSANATGNHSSETLTIQGNIASKPDGSTLTDAYFYQVIYEWADNQGNIYRSAPSIPVSVTTTGTGSTGTITINVPTLRLTYKTPNPVKIVIYRWSVEVETYHQVTSITAPLLNDTTVDSVTFVDTLPDADIEGNDIIYTTGGVVENINPPASNLFTLFDDRFWLVDAEDQNLLWFSKQVIEATPVEMSDLLTVYVAPTIGAQGSTGPVTALSVMDDKLIIFKKNAIYYMNGTGPDNTGANSQYSQPIFITSTVGCSNQQSIVFMQNGLMFQSDKGIWLLGRDLSTEYIGAPVEEFNDAIVQSALNIPATTQVRFTLSTGVTLMYDYYYAQWGTFTGLPAISSCLFQGLQTSLNSFGQIYQETPGLYLDGSNPVLISFLTGHIQLQGISGYQALFEIQFLGEYISPHFLNFQLGYDFAPLSEQALISPLNETGVYGSDSLYGMTSPYGGPGVLEQWRIQPATQNCQAFQMSVKEVYDPSFGIPAGAGFSLSALTCTLGLMRGYRPVKAAQTVGTS